MWPRQPLKHFTAAYRGFPPCTQSQYPINRETGYSNVLPLFWRVIELHAEENTMHNYKWDNLKWKINKLSEMDVDED